MCNEGTLAVSEKIFGLRETDRTRTDQMIDDQLKSMREALAQTARMGQGSGQRNAVLGIEARIRELERSNLGDREAERRAVPRDDEAVEGPAVAAELDDR